MRADLITHFYAGKIMFTLEGLPKLGFCQAKPKLQSTQMLRLTTVNEVPPSIFASQSTAKAPP